VLEKSLCVGEIPKIMSFSEHVMSRQLDLYKEYCNTFKNVYKERVAGYFRPN